MTDTTSNADMNFDDIDNSDTYDKAEAAKSGDFGEPVPDGKYQCIIDKAWLALSGPQSKNPGSRMLRWQLKIIGGKYGGRMLFRNNMIESPDNIKWLKGDLQVCGLEIHKLNELRDRVSSLIGVGVEVQVKNQGKDPQGRANQNVYLNKAVEIDRAAAGESQGGGGEGGATGASAGGGGFTDDEIPF
jgi:hypothetical protein